MQCNYNSFIRIINFHGLFRNALRCRGAEKLVCNSNDGPDRHLNCAIQITHRNVILRTHGPKYSHSNDSNCAIRMIIWIAHFCSRVKTVYDMFEIHRPTTSWNKTSASRCRHLPKEKQRLSDHHPMAKKVNWWRVRKMLQLYQQR